MSRLSSPARMGPKQSIRQVAVLGFAVALYRKRGSLRAVTLREMDEASREDGRAAFA